MFLDLNFTLLGLDQESIRIGEKPETKASTFYSEVLQKLDSDKPLVDFEIAVKLRNGDTEFERTQVERLKEIVTANKSRVVMIVQAQVLKQINFFLLKEDDEKAKK